MLKLEEITEKIWMFLGNKNAQAGILGITSIVASCKTIQAVQDGGLGNAAYYGAAALISGAGSYFLYREKL